MKKQLFRSAAHQEEVDGFDLAAVESDFDDGFFACAPPPPPPLSMISPPENFKDTNVRHSDTSLSMENKENQIDPDLSGLENQMNTALRKLSNDSTADQPPADCLQPPPVPPKTEEGDDHFYAAEERAEQTEANGSPMCASESSPASSVKSSTSKSLSRQNTRSIMRQHEVNMARDRRRSARFSRSNFPLEVGDLNFMMTADEDQEEFIDDTLALAQKKLKELKSSISAQSKRNFLLERDVRYLDGRIALLIHNRKALDEDISHFGDALDALNSLQSSDTSVIVDDRKKQLYGNLFFLLQAEPRLVAHLTRLVSLAEIDTLLQTVMFTLYGNQYDQREEHLLLTMFQSVLQVQFEKTSEFNELLRANTPASRMMTTYTRRGPGQQYLKHVLADTLNHVIERASDNLDINPVKIYEQMINQMETETGETSCLPRTVSPEDAASNVQVQQILEPRAAKLMELAQTVLDTVISSLEEIPYGIRWICKQIRSLTIQKYPTASEGSICSLIGGFFFLRFINPAIVTPQSNMLVDLQPDKNARRALTLIAKMLQNLANKPTFNKEAYMNAMEPFIIENKERVLKFLAQLCDVDDFYESLELDQYMALSKKDLMIQITPNELFSMHELLERHLDVISPAVNPDKLKLLSAPSNPQESYQLSCCHLRQVILDLGSAPQQLPRLLNKAINLPLFSRWDVATILFPNVVNPRIKWRLQRASICDRDVARDQTSVYIDMKFLIIQILRRLTTLPTSKSGVLKPRLTVTNIETEPLLLDIPTFLARVAKCTDAVLSKKSVRALQNLRILQDMYYDERVSCGDHSQGETAIAKEIEAEFLQLNQLWKKVVGEIESLELVFQTMVDQHQDLRAQLSSYEAYLTNVRIQAAGGVRRLAGGSKTPLFMVGGGAGTPGAGFVSTNSNTSQIGRRKSFRASTGIGKQNYNHAIKFSHLQLEKDGILVDSGVPENRRANIYFSVKSPIPGSFMMGMHYKGRDQPIYELEITLDDLLEKQQDNIQILNLEYVQLNVNKILHMLNKYFLKR